MACTKHYSARCHSYKLICLLLWASYSIKKGGPSPSSNTALAAILEKARELDIPREILERNIKRASEKDQDTYTEKVYEVIFLCCQSMWYFVNRFSFYDIDIACLVAIYYICMRKINLVSSDMEQACLLLPPFQIVVRLTFLTLSLTTRLIQKLCANIAKFKSFLKILY